MWALIAVWVLFYFLISCFLAVALLLVMPSAYSFSSVCGSYVMADPKPSQREKLLEQQRQLAAKIAALNAREKSTERKTDTRRKILIGGAVNASIKRGKFSEEQLMTILNRELFASRDRSLFDLPPRPDGLTKPPRGARPILDRTNNDPGAISPAGGRDRPLVPVGRSRRRSSLRPCPDTSASVSG
ncbi:hypothetical protein [Sphingomonas sp. PAMC 26621]|uniref:hypothetical protein n=1 Tax=Sphingomonas sp. PAMC 26621 TaxID=1112213 RepID=UPI00111122E5|nr:hypothetical protein [Sphingomonas sp. PAMC 26621]